MGTAQSKTPSSSLDVGTASIIERSSSSTSFANEQTSTSSSTQLSATKTDDILLTQHNTQPYNPPLSKTPILTHYIFLVHGWLGNDLEMAYLGTAFKSVLDPNSLIMDGSNNNNGGTNDDVAGTPPDQKRVRRSSSYLTHITSQQHNQTAQQRQVATTIQPEVVVHSVKCNVGKTTDGIINGGKRLANEIINFIKDDVENRLLDAASSPSTEGEDQQHHVTYSIVGNSLGGLYSRYAISLLPYQLPININSDGTASTQKGRLSMLNIHPNIFCTTATPHLGVSRHTYLPIPRIAETIIGTGMGKTGEDLFRLNSDKMNVDGGLKNGGLMEHVGRGVRRLSALRSSNNLKDDAEDEEDINNGITNFSDETDNQQDEEELECIIHNMCTSEKYLSPLRNFRQRIAYANVYGTDFQVPTLTAAFLNEKSGVGHFVVGSRDLNSATGDGSIEEKKEEDTTSDGEVAAVAHKRELSEHVEDTTTDEKKDKDAFPPFIVAVVRTEKQTQPQSPTKAHYIDDATADDELLQMSQSLDALGWTKVFIDVRDRIPVPGLAKPAWLKGPYGSLDDLIRERKGLKFDSLHQSHTNIGLSTESGAATVDNASEEASKATPKVYVDDTASNDEQCILTSQELAASTNSGDSFHFPLGHTVMVANSKSEQYSKLNSQGRPVMDRLAENMVESVLEFE